MSEDERTKLRRLSQEALDALRGEGQASERTWELFHLLMTRLLRLELGSFAPEETPTAPAKRFTSTEAGPNTSPTPKAFDAVQPKRFNSTERWTADSVKELFEEARGKNEK
jgi:hypothetical protein